MPRGKLMCVMFFFCTLHAFHFRINFLYSDSVNECNQKGICGNQNCIDTVGSYNCTCEGLDISQVANILPSIRGKLSTLFTAKTPTDIIG